ncbi:RsmB/NOP family class I SAM-dependent RNA methyltransferase [Lutimaribacter marinistellae]|uniref:RsmB/NOP family class I SAM-dependent RNA methyltransferase n=1 Tax=Lutimaribacter marinistellae TaxID=1820329 RepID=A0ABV7TPT1_9RHOB
MTPGARIAAAIEILDEIGGGAPAEKALTIWARRSRFAGSKDRAAIRDHVFDALRCRRSFAALGGGEDGRRLMIGALRAAGASVDEFFSGEGHAPAPLAQVEATAGRKPNPGAEAGDIPDWLWPEFCDSLGDDTETEAEALRHRAPVHLRVNLRKADVPNAKSALHEDGVETRPHPACSTALEVIAGARRINGSRAYRDGLVELQDAASQAVVAALPLAPGMRVLDFCAGGGGKTLALAAVDGVEVFAHDANAARMKDLPERAARAGVDVTYIHGSELCAADRFDVVLIDVPCSGSGSWRRAPAGKWLLSPERLADLVETQAAILHETSQFVAPDGLLAYATCSMLNVENGNQIRGFLEDLNWSLLLERAWHVSRGTDGFYTAHLTRNAHPD